jgi:two-component system OmpR family sensor kinase
MIARLPFRTRLTAIYLTALIVALVAFGAIAFAVVSATLDRTLDIRLGTAIVAARAITDVKDGRMKLDQIDREQLRTLLGDGINGFVSNGGGAVVASSVVAIPHEISNALGKATPLGTARTMRVASGAIELAVAPILDGPIPVGRIMVWQSRESHGEFVRVMLFALFAIGLTIVGVTVAIGGALAKRAMSPLSELAAMVSEIEAHDLSERLAWRGPDDELGQLCATFDRLLDRLQGAFERQRRFTADASHELRAPLSVIRAEADLALRKPRDSQEYRAALETIRAEVGRFEALVEDLLAAARAESGAVSTRLVDAGTVASGAVARVAPLARERAIELRVDAPEGQTIEADPASLERAVLALLDNALRHASAGGVLHVEVRTSGTSVRIAVRDDGPGFSGAALRFATDRFWRDDLTREGTGLGLAIAKATAERFGGTLELDNASRGGACATLHFKVADRARRARWVLFDASSSDSP